MVSSEDIMPVQQAPTLSLPAGVQALQTYSQLVTSFVNEEQLVVWLEEVLNACQGTSSMEVLFKWKEATRIISYVKTSINPLARFPDFYLQASNFHPADKVELLWGEGGVVVRSGTIGPNTRSTVWVIYAWRSKVKM